MKKKNKNQLGQNNDNSNNLTNNNSHNNNLNINHNNYQDNNQNNTTYNYINCSNNGNQFIVDSRYSNNTNNNNNMNINNSNSNIYNNNSINSNNANNKKNLRYFNYIKFKRFNNRNNNNSNENNFVPSSAITVTYNGPQVNNNNQNINNNVNISQNDHNYDHFNISSFALSSNAMNNYEIMPENPNIRSKVDVTNNNYSNVLNQLPENTIEDLNKLNEENKSCIICLSEYEKGDTTIVLPCFHFFHKNCMINWYKRKATCPLCKLDIKSNL